MQDTTAIEHAFVNQVYDAVSAEFDTSRTYLWGAVKKFYDMVCLDTRPRLCDVGCGNGRNMLTDRCDPVGYDTTESLIEICRNKHLDVRYGSVVNIPDNDNIYDATICIAVIHHLDDYDRRVRAIGELIRITRSGGHILISVWAKTQTNTKCKYVFQTNDVYVPWIGKNNETLMRYYHVFNDDELHNLVIAHYSDQVNIVSYEYEIGNWYILLRKL